MDMLRKLYLCLDQFITDVQCKKGHHLDHTQSALTCKVGTVNASRWLVELEQHILLRCPQLDDLRTAHSHLFQTSGQALTDLFNDHSPMLLAKYVRAALLLHQSVLLLP